MTREETLKLSGLTETELARFARSGQLPFESMPGGRNAYTAFHVLALILADALHDRWGLPRLKAGAILQAIEPALREATPRLMSYPPESADNDACGCICVGGEPRPFFGAWAEVAAMPAISGCVLVSVGASIRDAWNRSMPGGKWGSAAIVGLKAVG